MPSNIGATLGEQMPVLLLPTDPLCGPGADHMPYQDVSPEQLKSGRKTSTIISMRANLNTFPSTGFYGFDEYVPPQKFHEIDSKEFAKMYKHDEVEDVKTNANNTMSVPQQLPVRKLSNTQFPQRKLSNTQSPLRKLSNTNNPHMNMTRQLSKERSISTTSNLTVSSPRRPMIRKSSVPQRLGELTPSDSWCSKKNEYHSSRPRIVDPKSGAHPKNRKTSDNNYYHTNKHEKPALWKDIRQAFSHAECESSASSLTLTSDHIVSMTEQPSYTKPSRKSSVRSGPITAYNKKSGFASVASYIQNCNAGQKERMKSTGRILWHRSVLAVNINHAR